MNYGSKDVGFILCDGYNLKGHLTAITDDGAEAITDEFYLLGDAWMGAKTTGNAKSGLTQEGFFDDAVAGQHEGALAGQGVRRVFCYSVGGNAVGSLFTGFAGALQTKYNRVLQMLKLHRAKVEYVVSGEREDGVTLHPHVQESAGGNSQGTPHDNGAATTNGGSAYLQVSQMAGITALDVKVRHSVDNAVWVDLATFTQVPVAALRKGERKAIVGTINRYTSTTWTPTGAGTFTFMVGVTRA
jgi:hypothetical protein